MDILQSKQVRRSGETTGQTVKNRKRILHSSKPTIKQSNGRKLHFGKVGKVKLSTIILRSLFPPLMLLNGDLPMGASGVDYLSRALPSRAIPQPDQLHIEIAKAPSKSYNSLQFPVRIRGKIIGPSFSSVGVLCQVLGMKMG
jgi:hypothetical protein